ncbi:MAG: hypothetical protein Q9166_004701 [cf. Caloplaca sp. 2 TL-2023]
MMGPPIWSPASEVVPVPRDVQLQVAQFAELQEGVQGLLIRHRELAKAKIHHEQYWLRQDYARTDRIRRIRNWDIRKKRMSSSGEWTVTRKRELSADSDATVQDDETELPVDAEDLYIDSDVYEFRLFGFEKQIAPGECIPEAEFEHLNHLRQETSSELKMTFDTIRQGQYLSLDEVLERFEDFQKRAAALVDLWEDEDAARGSKIDMVYPRVNLGNCACTAEQKLYHKCLAFGYPQDHTDLEREMFKSDMWVKQRQIVTADRNLEIEELLQSFDDHLDAQVADVEVARSGESRHKALITYLNRYDQQAGFRIQAEGGSFPSQAVTFDLLRKTDDMLDRWADEDASRSRRLADMLRKD